MQKALVLLEKYSDWLEASNIFMENPSLKEAPYISWKMKGMTENLLKEHSLFLTTDLYVFSKVYQEMEKSLPFLKSA